MRKRIIGWTERFLRWRMVGRPVWVIDHGQAVWGGTIMGVQIDEIAGEVVVTAFHATDGVAPFDLGCGHQPVLQFPLTTGLTWNGRREQFEVDANGLECRRRHHPEIALASGAHRPGDRQAPRQEPFHGQGPSQAAGPSAQEDRRSHRESARGVPPRHDVASPSESPQNGADDPGEDSDAGGAGPAGTLTLAVRDDGWIPDGVLIGVDPDQGLHIYRLDMPPPPMPDGTIIWANAFTAQQYSAWARRVMGDPKLN